MVMCCLLGVCCPPEQRAAQLAKFLYAAGSETTEKDCEILANALLETFDLAPAGLSAFLVEKYGPAFAGQ